MSDRGDRSAPDLVRVLEATYAVEEPEDAWLRGLMHAIRPAIEDGLGIGAYLYDVSERPFRVRNLLVEDCPIDEAGLAMLQHESNDDFVRDSWIARSAMTSSETPGYEDHPAVHQVFHPVGIRDVMVINAIDPIGVGCWIGAPLRNVHRLTEDERERYNRVAAHVRASLRLRLRLAARPASPTNRSGAAEAVFRPDGAVVHLERPAEEQRTALRDAVLGIQRARTVLRNEPDRALPSWKAMVRARWSLVEAFEANGDHFIVARANALEARPLSRLSAREQQVVACLSMGLTSKEAAYELGLSHSTVRVLIARSCAKLGVPSRAELVAAYRGDVVASAT